MEAWAQRAVLLLSPGLRPGCKLESLSLWGLGGAWHRGWERYNLQ